MNRVDCRSTLSVLVAAAVASTAPAAFAQTAAQIASRAPAAPSLEAFAGVVGGDASGVNVPGTCSTYGAPEPEASFFQSSVTMAVPQGGIAECGYGGGTMDVPGTVGPLTATQAMAPVLLGNPGFAGTYTGGADASADYKTLRAAAHGTVTAPGSGSPLARDSASAAAIFEDLLTAVSPAAAAGSAGFVRYTFAVDGTLTVPGPLQGVASAMLRYQHDDGPNFQIVSITIPEAGALGSVGATDHSTGNFVAAPGSMSGGGSFTTGVPNGFGGTIDRPIIWGQPFRLKAGLMATVIGDGQADFQAGARLSAIDFFDDGHNPVGNVTITSASGTFYGTCTYSVAPTAQSIGAAGGVASVTVTAPAGCPWTAVTDYDFVTVTAGAAGNGTANVSYSVRPNAGPARTATLAVAGQTVTVTQASGEVSLPLTSACRPVDVAAIHTVAPVCSGPGPFLVNRRLALIENGTVPCLNVDTGEPARCQFLTRRRPPPAPRSNASVRSAAADTLPEWQRGSRDEDDDCDEDRHGRSEGEACDARGGKFFTGDWLEDRRGRRYAVMGQSVSLDGTRGGDFAIAAKMAQDGTVPCVGARGGDAEGTMISMSMASACTIEVMNSETNRSGLLLINWATLNVCTSSNPSPDQAVLDHADLARGIYCYRGQGAGLNDLNGMERDATGVYYPNSDYCHVVTSGGYMVPAAKRPSTASLPAPGRVKETTRVRWLPVNTRISIANW